MKYCHECGHELRPGAKVCTNCGVKINTADSQYTAENKEEFRQRDISSNEKAPMDPKKKRLAWITAGVIGAAAVVLLIAYQILANTYSPEGTLDDFADAVSSENADEVQNLVDNDITTEEAQAYITYVSNEVGFSQFDSWINNAVTAINDGSAGSTVHDSRFMLLEVRQNGRHLGLFDDYDLIIPKHNIMVDGEVLGDTFTYEYAGSETEWSTSDSKFAELIPGIYQFNGTVNVDDEQYESVVAVNFDEYSDYETIYGNADVNLYYVDFEVPVLWSWYDIEPEDITLNVNGETEDVAVDNDSENKLGPYKFGEDYELTGTLNYEDETFDMKPVTLNVTDEEDLYDTRYTASLEFDEQAISEHSDEVYETEMSESERESFEEDMEFHAEQFITDYFYDLEDAYSARDIVYVEEYLNEGSEPYETLASNFANDNFPNLTIWNIDMVKFERDEEDIYIEVYTQRLNDDLDESAEFKTGYNLKYDPDDLSFKILSFVDL